MIEVLDHGYVRLVNCMGGDVDISRAARVSYNHPPRDEDGKLIRYLMKNRHTSPFEAVVLTFEVQAPIFILRQWHRHRTWSYNEVSARYTELPEVFYVPSPDKIGTQSTDNKQMRTDEENALAETAVAVMGAMCQDAFKTYRDLLEMGTPRELARSVLPLATYSRMFATVDLHNLFHFLRLRIHEHAQWEIREYAKAMMEITRQVAPLATEAFEDTL